MRLVKLSSWETKWKMFWGNPNTNHCINIKEGTIPASHCLSPEALIMETLTHVLNFASMDQKKMCVCVSVFPTLANLSQEM